MTGMDTSRTVPQRDFQLDDDVTVIFIDTLI